MADRPPGTCQGKTALVTGGTSGIGLVTAEALARAGARVVVVGRDAGRCEQAVRSIREKAGHHRVEAVLGDLSTFDGARRVADEAQARLDRLDVLVNNAGASYQGRALNADGVEKTFALNHFGYFVLTLGLLDLLRRSAPSRVVSVASDAHRMARRVNEANLRGPAGYSGWRAYAESKLANVLFSNELARRLDETGVTSNALHPGFVRTRFFEEGRGLGGWLVRRFAGLAAMSPEAGAMTSIYLASSPEVEGVTGRYFEKCRERTPAPSALDGSAARRLWDLSSEWTGLDG